MDAERHSDSPTFGDLLRRHRLAAGLTQEELAERATMSARGISDLERGARTNPQRETVALLIAALDLRGTDAAAFRAARRRPAAATVAAPEPVALRVVPRDVWPGALPPTPPDLLIGRETEVAAVTALLSGPAIRLLTLLGPGGIGKTRLAIAGAEAMRAESDLSVAFVPLGAIVAPELVVPTIARTLDINEVGGRTLEDQLVLALRRQVTLLVLDTFEQIVEAGPVVARLLAACPSLKVLVTSRIPLRISGEQRFPVQPLPTPAEQPSPDPDVVADAAAARLFVARARAVDPAFAMTTINAADVAAICRRLDGLPLAIELAAARVAHSPVAVLHSRLERRLPVLTGGARDAPPRQRTLRDTIAWSYDLLDAAEQALFRRLGVFAGSFSLEAAEAITNVDPTIPGDPLDGLDLLLDSNLLVRRELRDDELRLGMLDTIREFALEQLATSGEEALVRDAHADYFRQLAERAAPDLFGAHPEVWTARLSLDHGNIVAALDWHHQKDDPTALGWLAATLKDYWFFAGRWSEGLRWLDWACDRIAEMPDDVAGMLLWATGYTVQQIGDRETAMPLLERARELRRRVGDVQGEAHCVFTMGMAAEDHGDYEAAVPFLTESRRLWLAIDDFISVAYAEFVLGRAFLGLGVLDNAAAWGRAALERSVGLGSVHAAIHSTFVLVDVALAHDDLSEAAARYWQALKLPSTLGRQDPDDLQNSAVFSGGTRPLVSAAAISAGYGDFERAAMFFGTADRRLEDTGARNTRPWERHVNAEVATRAALGAARFDVARARGMTLGPEAVRTEIEAVLTIASDASSRPPPAPDSRDGGRGPSATSSPTVAPAD